MDNIGLEKGKVDLLEYDESYTKIFIKEKKNLEKMFLGLYDTIEHVGSTAIKNIKSKPIIDILIATSDINNFVEYAKKYAQSDTYTLKENECLNELLIRKEEDGKVKAFIHVLPTGSQEARNYILFRDYLNSNKGDALEYEKLKEELFLKYKDDRKNYTKGKEEFIASIIQKANIAKMSNN